MCKIINWPKRLSGETPSQYADRVGVDELKAVEYDPVTQETRYVGYGWYDPNAEADE